MFLLACLLSAAAAPVSPPVADLTVKLDQNKETSLASLHKDGEVLVLVFVAATCPVTSLYWERLKGIWYNYRGRGVALYLVGGNSDDSRDQLAAILAERKLELPVVWDDGHRVAQVCNLKFTPAVLILGKNDAILYRGRIDDSWRDESRVQKRFLEDAIAAALDGKQSANQLAAPFLGSRMR